ncbi:hypothetical protein ACFVUW_11270 [Streptomyces xiamenensis]|uniref:hypothetical protein n=1 Tax=Streptomyces xiamenensis TaxID=408015 RepID=UPI0036EDA515
MESIETPPGVHLTVNSSPDATGGGIARGIAVWSDWPYRVCPSCQQPIGSNRGCPLTLWGGAPGGPEYEMLDQACPNGCGAILSVYTVGILAGDPDDLEAAVRDAVREVEQDLADHRARIVAKIGARLRSELEHALTATDPEGAMTGSSTQPGVYDSGEGIIAWDWDPTGTQDDGIIAAIEHSPN